MNKNLFVFNPLGSTRMGLTEGARDTNCNVYRDKLDKLNDGRINECDVGKKKSNQKTLKKWE